MKDSFSRFLLAPLMALMVAGLAAPAEAARDGGGARDGGTRAGGASAKQNAQVNNSNRDVRTNDVRSGSVNNVNVNKNVNVNVDSNQGGCCGGWDNDHPVAKVAVATATVAAIGSLVRAPPPGCVPVNYGGIVYQQCGTTWYQPQGSQYVVVGPPY